MGIVKSLAPESVLMSEPPYAASISPHPGTRTGYFGVADFFRILRRRIGLIVLVVMLGLLATIIGIARTTPVYSASATIVVLPPDESVVASVPTATVISPNQETEIETKVQILKSRKLLARTAAMLQLERDPEFAPPLDVKPKLTDRLVGLIMPRPAPETDPKLREAELVRARNEAVVDRLVDQVEVARVARSSTIQVTASSNDPKKAALLANRIVETYIRGQIGNAKDSHEEEIQELTQRVADAKNYLQQADAAATAFRSRNRLLSSAPEEAAAQQVAQLVGLLTQARSDAAQETRRATPGAGAGATSPLLVGLLQQEATLLRRLSELGSFYGPGYPDVAKARAELASLQPKITQETNRIAAERQTEAAAGQARQSAIGAGIGGIREQALQAGTLAVPLRALERNAQAANTHYMSLLNTLNARIGTPADTNPDISIVSRASVPPMPSQPMPQRALAVAFLAALALGVVIAYVVETMDTTIRTAEQVERLLGIPTLAMVPDLTRDSAGSPVYAMVGERPRSQFAEAMRNLLIELESRQGSAGSQIVLVTSPLDGEGKNTIATSLAAAAAAIGRHAVVVDFDLRRPELGTGLPVAQQTGVVAYLSGSAVMDDLPVMQEGGNFETIAVGATPVDPGALIASPRLPMMLEQLRERYDLVIINAPPILPVRDAKTLAELTDSTVLVLRWGRSKPEAARVAIDMFERPIAGAVINRVDYNVHAARRYGDAIHHIANATRYFDEQGQPERRWLPHSLRQAWSRVTGALRPA